MGKWNDNSSIDNSQSWCFCQKEQFCISFSEERPSELTGSFLHYYMHQIGKPDYLETNMENVTLHEMFSQRNKHVSQQTMFVKNKFLHGQQLDAQSVMIYFHSGK